MRGTEKLWVSKGISEGSVCIMKNKTEALMLINRIEARIQHLEMSKLKNYEVSEWCLIGPLYRIACILN